MADTVRGAVAERDAQQAEVAGIEARVRAARDWFNTVVPSHIDGDQFIAMCIGALRRNHDLMQAATLNPGPFMVAASECARLGLVPGETYHFVAFRNRDTGFSDITGIVDYKGEIDMIYRAGGVLSVHAQVVRAADKFVWRPGMELPLHEILPNDSGQLGLADEDERGPLTGVYAYARLADGGFSDVIVMPLSEVAKHEAVAKTDKFWKGPWRPDMFLKTAIHKLYDRVPHSQEYLAERIRAMSAPPAPGVDALPTRQPAQISGPPQVPGMALGRRPPDPEGVARPSSQPPAAQDDTQNRNAPDDSGHDPESSGEPQDGRGRGNRGAPSPAPQGSDDPADALMAAFEEVGLGGDRHEPARLAIISALARESVRQRKLALESGADLAHLSPGQVARAASNVRAVISSARAEQRDPREDLLKIAQASGWDGTAEG